MDCSGKSVIHFLLSLRYLRKYKINRYCIDTEQRVLSVSLFIVQCGGVRQDDLVRVLPNSKDSMIVSQMQKNGDRIFKW